MRRAEIWKVSFSGMSKDFYVEASSVPQAVERAETEADNLIPEAEGKLKAHCVEFWRAVYVEEPQEDF